MERCSSSSLISRTSTPPMLTEPESTSQKRGMRRSMVVLPEPEGPTTAVIAPAGICALSPSRTGPPAS